MSCVYIITIFWFLLIDFLDLRLSSFSKSLYCFLFYIHVLYRQADSATALVYIVYA